MPARRYMWAAGPVLSLLHAAVATSAKETIRVAMRGFIPTSALAFLTIREAPKPVQ